jgi:hypothetical protein
MGKGGVNYLGPRFLLRGDVAGGFFIVLSSNLKPGKKQLGFFIFVMR